MKKIYKKVEQENGTITFYGTNRWQKLYMGHPEWHKREESPEYYFKHQGRRNYISEFDRVNRPNVYMPEYMKEFDAYQSDSFFSGICIKFPKYDDWEHEDMVKVFVYIS